MFLELSARYLLERHHAVENDPLLRFRVELRNGPITAADEAVLSAEIAGVSFGDGTRRRRDMGPDVGRLQHLDPAPGTEQNARRLFGPVHPQPEP
jgi:hypothetical protein